MVLFLCRLFEFGLVCFDEELVGKSSSTSSRQRLKIDCDITLNSMPKKNNFYFIQNNADLFVIYQKYAIHVELFISMCHLIEKLTAQMQRSLASECHSNNGRYT